MHTAPWADETLPADTPPILRVLRGDFFCAPFGPNDLIPEMSLVHGLTANGSWRLVGSTRNTIDATLEGTVLGSRVDKHVEVRAGESIVYQRHTLTGGDGRLPIGHHAMLHADHRLELAFAPMAAALTPPVDNETPPLGRPLLAPDQTITDLASARRRDGGTVDLSTYPTPDGYEGIWMVVADRASAFGWTAATNAEEGWVWFGLKNPRVLPQTLLWCSNRGRDYAPWNGRHVNAIGLEEICAYFHLGHAASIAPNPVADSGSPTAIALDPQGAVTVSYLFGLAAIPEGFGRVRDIIAAPGGITLRGAGGHEVFAPCELDYINGAG